MSCNSSIYDGLIELGIDSIIAAQAAKDYANIDSAIDAIFNPPTQTYHSQSEPNPTDQTLVAIQQSLDSIQQTRNSTPTSPQLSGHSPVVCVGSSSPHLAGLAAYWESLIATTKTQHKLINNSKLTPTTHQHSITPSPIMVDPSSVWTSDQFKLVSDWFQQAVVDQSGVISIDPVCEALEIDPTDYQHSNNNVNQINHLHNKLVNSIAYYSNKSTLDTTPFPILSFTLASGDSLATDGSARTSTTTQTLIQANLTSTTESIVSIYDAIDCQLWQSEREEYFASLPETLVVQFDQPRNSRSNKVKLSQTISLDRYLAVNLEWIRTSRAKLSSLNQEIQTIRDSLAMLETSPNQQQPAHLIENAISHSDRQPSLQAELIRIRDGIKFKVSELQDDLARLNLAKEAAFERRGADHQAGADYTLTGFMIRNGLNGRSSCFSVVAGQDGDYYKISDSIPTKVELEAAIQDKTGLILGAGLAFAFYHQTTRSQPLELRGGADSDSSEQDYSSDDDQADYEDEVELGTLVKIQPGQTFDVDLGVGKVGGKPVWLDPSNPLDYNQLGCDSCHQTMSFVLLLNSPDDTRPHAAARTMYLFACRTSSCQFQTKLFRTQNQSPNPFFPHTPQTKANRVKFEALLDPVTGFGGSQSPDKAEPVVWPEFEIECEEEPYEESYLPEISHNPIDDQIEQDDSTAPDTAVAVDRTFLEFQARLSRVPEQVIRFYRLPGVDSPKGLLVSDSPLDEVHPCTLCGAARELEFQVVPTLLSYLSDEVVQFDSLLVYTCSQNCDLSLHNSWAHEQVIQQSYSNQGVRFGAQS